MANNNSPLRNRSLIIIGISESVSGIGSWITMMAVFAMVVFRGEGNAVQSSGIFLAGLLPTLLFSSVAGWLCDRYNRKGLMIASELLSGAIIAGLIFVRRLELIYLLLGLQSLSTSLMMPARQAVVPDLVAKGDLTRANAFLQQLAGIIKIGSPILAGAILAVMDPHQAIILDVVSFALSALILSRLPALLPHKMPASQSAGNTPQSSFNIFSVLKSLPGLRLLFAAIFLGITIIVGFDILSSIFTRDILHGNESLFGLMVGLVGLGTLGATLLLMLRKKNTNPWLDVISGILLLAFVPASLAIAGWIGDPNTGRWLVIAGCLIGGIGNGLVNVQVGTLIQILSPAALLGRMGGLYQTIAVSGQLVGILLTPLLVPSLMSMATYFSIATAAVILLVIYIALSLRNPLVMSPATGD